MSGSVPPTGDKSNPTLWVLLVVMNLGAVVATVIKDLTRNGLGELWSSVVAILVAAALNVGIILAARRSKLGK